MAKETDFNDEYAGQGGNYEVDPKTGKRKLVHRTEERPLEVATPAKETTTESPSAEQ